MSEIKNYKKSLSLARWKEIIEDRNRSAISVRKYCQINGISESSYYYWLRVLRHNYIESTEIVNIAETAQSKNTVNFWNHIASTVIQNNLKIRLS